MYQRILGVCALSLLTGCASTSVTPISSNAFVLDTSAAPVCGSAGASKVAAKMAAVETLRAGYDGYVVQGMQAENNVRIVQTAPTSASTTSTYTGYGNQVYGRSNTTFNGGSPMVLGKHNQKLVVRMFKREERGFEDAVDARQFLGDDWQVLVDEGVRTCS